jgi:hypothetical protein
MLIRKLYLVSIISEHQHDTYPLLVTQREGIFFASSSSCLRRDARLKRAQRFIYSNWTAVTFSGITASYGK